MIINSQKNKNLILKSVNSSILGMSQWDNLFPKNFRFFINFNINRMNPNTYRDIVEKSDNAFLKYLEKSQAGADIKCEYLGNSEYLILIKKTNKLALLF